jgi:tRNA U34 5-carboxymethylaminomethyl modifying enzyme MnmG/GidA
MQQLLVYKREPSVLGVSISTLIAEVLLTPYAILSSSIEHNFWYLML